MHPLTVLLLANTVAAGKDADGDGYSVPHDCDDSSPSVYPGAPEQCNEQDDNCDGQIDEGYETRWVPDTDQDGAGQDVEPEVGCYPQKFPPPPGGGTWTTTAAVDCDDNDPLRAPFYPEWCDGIDNDCNDIVDDVTEYDRLREIWPDADGDGFGAFGDRDLGCAGDGWVEETGDCDDADAAVHPDAVERCNGVDDDCDGIVDPGCEVDQDGDGYAAGIDCVDGVAEINPEADELCNGRDDDCDGEIDEGCRPAAAETAEPGCGCAATPAGLTWIGMLAVGLTRRGGRESVRPRR